jgi:hypothetical protein
VWTVSSLFWDAFRLWCWLHFGWDANACWHCYINLTRMSSPTISSSRCQTYTWLLTRKTGSKSNFQHLRGYTRQKLWVPNFVLQLLRNRSEKVHIFDLQCTNLCFSVKREWARIGAQYFAYDQKTLHTLGFFFQWNRVNC